MSSGQTCRARRRSPHVLRGDQQQELSVDPTWTALLAAGKRRSNLAVRFGISGHQELTSPEGWHEVEQGLRRILADATPPLIGVSSLAAGADQLFARLLLQLGGDLTVVLPFVGYERTF